MSKRQSETKRQSRKPKAKAESNQPFLYTDIAQLMNDQNLKEIRSRLPPVPDPYPYPFTTKKFTDNTLSRKQPRKNATINSFIKFQRPYFSPKFNSWECDFFSEGYTDKEINQRFERYYLIFVNINTKFVKLYPLKFNQSRKTEIAIEKMNDLIANYEVDNLRSDKDAVFQKEFKEYLERNNIKYHSTVSKYTNENRVVDRAIKTIRDAIGIDRNILLYFPEVVLQIVDYYNNTPHSAYKNKFTPQQVQNDRELEAWYIRTQQLKLFDVLKQQQKSFRRYNQGDLLIVYRPLGKTDEVFKKRRRNFQELAMFEKYDHGNVVVRLLTADGQTGTKEITLPLYYTKFVCDGQTFWKYGVPPAYRQFLSLSTV
jgi:hypothetical protein